MEEADVTRTKSGTAAYEGDRLTRSPSSCLRPLRSTSRRVGRTGEHAAVRTCFFSHVFLPRDPAFRRHGRRGGARGRPPLAARVSRVAPRALRPRGGGCSRGELDVTRLARVWAALERSAVKWCVARWRPATRCACGVDGHVRPARGAAPRSHPRPSGPSLARQRGRRRGRDPSPPVN